VTGEYEHSSSKYRSPSERHDEKKAFFMDQWLWLNFSALWRLVPWIKLHRWYVQESNGMHSRVQNIKCRFSWKWLDQYWLNFNHVQRQWTQIVRLWFLCHI
jgi:hypothetical protein